MRPECEALTTGPSLRHGVQCGLFISNSVDHARCDVIPAAGTTILAPSAGYMMAQMVQGQPLAREPPPDAARQLWPVRLNLDGNLNREKGVLVLAQDLDGHEPVRAVRQGRLDHLACRPEGVLASGIKAGEGQALIISGVPLTIMRVEVEAGHSGPSHTTRRLPRGPRQQSPETTARAAGA